jgi:hypothetical protein
MGLDHVFQDLGGTYQTAFIAPFEGSPARRQ